MSIRTSRRRTAAGRRRARRCATRPSGTGPGSCPRGARAWRRPTADRGASTSRRGDRCPSPAGARAARAGRGSGRRTGSCGPSRAGARGSRGSRRPTTGGPRRRTRPCPSRPVARRRSATRRTAPPGRPPGPRRSRAGSGCGARSRHARCRRGCARCIIAATATPGLLLVVALGQAGPPPDHLAERPERHALAVRRRASAMPPDRFDDAIEVLLELPGEPALADPAWPTSETRRARRSRPTAWNCSLRKRSSSVRPTNGGSRASGRRAPPRSPTTRTASHDGTGEALPFRTWSPAGVNSMAASAVDARRLADEDPAGRGHRLEPGRRVDHVAGDHALAFGADG